MLELKGNHFELIAQAKEKKNVVALKPKDDKFVPRNLEYSVEATLTGERQLPICKIRIPSWVEFEWTGDWSKTSSKWTAEKKKELKVDDDENSIWMSWGDVQAKFSHVVICEVSDVLNQKPAREVKKKAIQPKPAPEIKNKEDAKAEPPKAEVPPKAEEPAKVMSKKEEPKSAPKKEEEKAGSAESQKEEK